MVPQKSMSIIRVKIYHPLILIMMAEIKRKKKLSTILDTYKQIHRTRAPKKEQAHRICV